MTDTSPPALRALAYRLTDVTSLTALTAAATLRALAAEKEAARDARRAALEEAAALVDEGGPWEDWGMYSNIATAQTVAKELAAAIRALIDDTGPSIADELAQARGFIKDYQRQLSEEMVRSGVAEATLAKVQEALDDLAIRLGDPQRRYDKIGPTWTGKDGHEYSDMSELLDFATEISEQAAAIRALIDREPAPVPDVEYIESVRAAAADLVRIATGEKPRADLVKRCADFLLHCLTKGNLAPTPTEPTP